jgi:hypothetical protein
MDARIKLCSCFLVHFVFLTEKSCQLWVRWSTARRVRGFVELETITVRFLSAKSAVNNFFKVAEAGGKLSIGSWSANPGVAWH